MYMYTYVYVCMYVYIYVICIYRYIYISNYVMRPVEVLGQLGCLSTHEIPQTLRFVDPNLLKSGS